jgi:uncharacterized Zn-finger protein
MLAKIDGCFYYKVKEINKQTRRLNSVLICAECKKPFTKKCNLIDHLRVHSGVKPFQCNICQKYFKQKAQLSKHCKKHSSGNKLDSSDEEDGDSDDDQEIAAQGFQNYEKFQESSKSSLGQEVSPANRSLIAKVSI